MEETKKWYEWEEELYANDNTMIWDPDGFRNMPEDTLYTQEDFEQRRWYCTIGPKRINSLRDGK